MLIEILFIIFLNILFSRTITQSPTHLLQRHKSECKSESISPIPPRRNYNNHIVSHSQMPTLSIDDTQLHRTSIGNIFTLDACSITKLNE